MRARIRPAIVPADAYARPSRVRGAFQTLLRARDATVNVFRTSKLAATCKYSSMSRLLRLLRH